PMPGPYRVGVVGLGVAGATTAYLLTRDGHQVTVLEQSERVGPAGAGVLLQTSGQEVLRHLGVLDTVTARAAPIDGLFARHDTGRTMIRHYYADLAPGFLAYGVHRGVLFNALCELLQTQPVEVRLGCDVTGREVTPDGVYLTDRVGGRHGPFDFVVAGDGARSRLREACGFKASVTKYSHGTLWVIAPGRLKGHLLQVVRGS